MADLDLQLKIRALVEGIHQVKGLADQVNLLNQAGKRPFGDPTTQLRAGARSSRQEMGLLSQSVFTLKNTIGALAAIATVRGLVQAADTYNLLRGRLTLVTSSAEELIAVEKRLFEVAQRTRSGYKETVELYARVARNAKSLGASQAELLQLTETVNQAIQVGGSTSSEAAAGVIQFSQALASGTLRGDELRSVLENMPRLSQAIIDGLEKIGVGANLTLGDLRRMSEQGELSSQRIFAALLTQADALKREFGVLPRTVGQAMTQMANDVQRAMAQADMTPLIDAIDGVREILSDPATLEAIKVFGTTLAQAINLALIPARELGAFMRWFRAQKDAAMSLPDIAATGDPERLQARIAVLRRTIDSLQAIQGMRGPLAGEKERMDAMRQEILTLERLRQAHSRRIAAEPGVDLTTKPPPAPTTPVEDQAARARLALATATADAELTIQQDILDRQQAGYERALEDRLISVREFYARKTAIDLAQVDAEIARQQRVVDEAQSIAAGAGDERDRLRALAEVATAEAELTVLSNRRSEVQIENARAAAKAETELRAELDKTRESLLDLQSQIVGGSPQLDLEVALLRVETEYQRILDVAKQLEGVDRQRAEQLASQWQALARQAATVQAQAAVAQKLAEAQRAAEDVTRATIDARQASGALTDLEALRATGEANRAVLEQLGQIRDAYLAMGEAGATAAAQVQAQMIDLAAQLDPLGDEIRGIFGSALSGFFESFAGESQSWKERFLGVAQDVVGELQRMFSQELAQQLLKSVGGLLGGKQAEAALAATTLTTGAAAAATALGAGGATAGGALGAGGTTAAAALGAGGASAAAAMIAGATSAAAILAGGQAAGGSAGLLAGLFHGGGIAGDASVYRRMPAVYLATAPRYHDGGIAGLAADEVPAVLRRGEEVLTANDPRHRGNGGLAPAAPANVSIRNINLFDTQEIGNYLASSAGERVVLNIMSRNKSVLT